jgi:hypothetical protein
VLLERVRVRLGMALVLVGKATLAELALEEGRREMRPERMRLSGGVAREDDDNELEGETGMRLVRVGSKSLGSLTGGRVTMPWTMSWQPSHTRRTATGDCWDWKCQTETPRGARWKVRSELSRRAVDWEVQAAQKTPPHIRQWWRRSRRVKRTRQGRLSHVNEEESGCEGGLSEYEKGMRVWER